MRQHRAMAAPWRALAVGAAMRGGNGRARGARVEASLCASTGNACVGSACGGGERLLWVPACACGPCVRVEVAESQGWQRSHARKASEKSFHSAADEMTPDLMARTCHAGQRAREAAQWRRSAAEQSHL